jgi:hypothetical protein
VIYLSDEKKTIDVKGKIGQKQFETDQRAFQEIKKNEKAKNEK